MTTQPTLPPTSVDETLATIREYARPLPVETVALAQAQGRVLRQAVTTPEDQPPFDVSAMDGYAVRLDDPAEVLRVVDLIRAGDWRPRELGLGEAVQIATGAPLPGAGLRVVMKEDTQRDGNQVRLLQRREERHIRFRGENARAGATLVAAGTRLTPGSLGLLASVGAVNLPVTRLSCALHLATGNEIVPPDQTPAPGQIRDSNSTLVAAFLGQFGVTPEARRVPEDEAVVRNILEQKLSAPPSPDLLLISGGASVGEHDFTRRLLEYFGFKVLISRTTTRPGKPLIFATREGALAFGLPGNPLAHFVCLHLYVRAALLGLSGVAAAPGLTDGKLAVEFAAPANERETLWPASWALVDGEARVTPLPWRSSGDLTALAQANSLARIPAGTGRLPIGTVIEFQPTHWL